MIIQPPSVLLVGPAGSGKTSALVTQLLHGLELFVIVTEPGGVDSLLDAAERLKAPIDKLHWSYCPPAATGWDGLETMINSISTMSQKQLADQNNMGKEAFRKPALKFLTAFHNFHCDRTGRDFGDISLFPNTTALAIDSLTGWSQIGFGCTVGFKPTANPGEWGIAQNFVLNMLTKINTDRQCFFALTAHVEKEMDELAGIKKLMVSTIGAKLAPKIPPLFSEVVRCKRGIDARNQPDFSWATIADDMDLKNRALPISTYLPADFGPVVAAYRKRLAAATAESPSASESAAPKLTTEPTGLQSPMRPN